MITRRRRFIPLNELDISGAPEPDKDDPHNNNTDYGDDNPEDKPEEDKPEEDNPEDKPEEDKPEEDNSGKEDDDAKPSNEDNPDYFITDDDPHNDNTDYNAEDNPEDNNQDDTTGDDQNQDGGSEDDDPHNDNTDYNAEDNPDNQGGEGDNTGETGGTPPSDDEGSEGDGEPSDNGGSGELEQDLKTLEDKVFSSLSDKDKKIKTMQLKDMYRQIYFRCDDIIVKLDKIIPDTDYIPAMKKIIATLNDLKKYISFYLQNNFDNKTYIENSVMFQKYLSILTGIKRAITQINVKSE